MVNDFDFSNDRPLEAHSAMSRLSMVALGLVAALLALGPGQARHAAADEPQKKDAPAAHAAPGAEAPRGPSADAGHGAADAAHGAAAAGHGAEGGHGEPNILEPQPSLVLFTVFVFLGLMGVLGKFAWKPLIEALHNREEHLEHVLHETEKARNESEQLLAEHRRQLAAAEEQIRGMIDEARKSAQTTADDIVKRAQAEADASRHRAEHDINTAKDQALAEIFGKTADLAVTVAGKVLGKSLGQDEQRRLVDSAINEIPFVANGHKGKRA